MEGIGGEEGSREWAERRRTRVADLNIGKMGTGKGRERWDRLSGGGGKGVWKEEGKREYGCVEYTGEFQARSKRYRTVQVMSSANYTSPCYTIFLTCHSSQPSFGNLT